MRVHRGKQEDSWSLNTELEPIYCNNTGILEWIRILNKITLSIRISLDHEMRVSITNWIWIEETIFGKCFLLLLKLDLKYPIYFVFLNDYMVCIVWFKCNIVISLLYKNTIREKLWPLFLVTTPPVKNHCSGSNKLSLPYYMCTLMFHCLSCLFKYHLYDSAEIRQPRSCCVVIFFSLSLSFFYSHGLWSISVRRKPHKASY